ncbi:MAG: hypothetical protein JW993_19830 [Sedimentisphaerales bacterium]|nr:hypothetical protein [Sedimentisphaerales bacterium]
MGARRNSVRGRVGEMWVHSADREWDVHRTLPACIEADNELQRKGLEPTPKFRRAVRANDEAYLLWWVRSCHFDWLNPR